MVTHLAASMFIALVLTLYTVDSITAYRHFVISSQPMIAQSAIPYDNYSHVVINYM